MVFVEFKSFPATLLGSGIKNPFGTDCNKSSAAGAAAPAESDIVPMLLYFFAIWANQALAPFWSSCGVMSFV